MISSLIYILVSIQKVRTGKGIHMHVTQPYFRQKSDVFSKVKSKLKQRITVWFKENLVDKYDSSKFYRRKLLDEIQIRVS